MTYNEQIITLIQEKKIIRSRDIDTLDIPREYLKRLSDTGVIEQIARGTYALADSMDIEYADLLEVSVRVPNSVVCLISALEYYELSTQLPFELWIAIKGTSWLPKIDYPPINVSRFSGDAFHYGIEEKNISGVPVKMYSIAKTIADCFKFRNKIGLDVAIEALREGIKDNRTHIDDIWQASKICRVQNIIKPYLEAIV